MKNRKNSEPYYRIYSYIASTLQRNLNGFSEFLKNPKGLNHHVYFVPNTSDVIIKQQRKLTDDLDIVHCTCL